MGWSKRKLVMKALTTAGLAASDMQVSPEQLADGMSSLDAMLAGWELSGIRLGRNTTEDLSADAGTPDTADRAVYLKLAIELAGSVGHELSSSVMVAAEQAYLAVLTAKGSRPLRARMNPALPLGAGHKTGSGTRRVFIEDEDTEIAAGPDSDLEFE